MESCAFETRCLRAVDAVRARLMSRRRKLGAILLEIDHPSNSLTRKRPPCTRGGYIIRPSTHRQTTTVAAATLHRLLGLALAACAAPAAATTTPRLGKRRIVNRGQCLGIDRTRCSIRTPPHSTHRNCILRTITSPAHLLAAACPAATTRCSALTTGFHLLLGGKKYTQRPRLVVVGFPPPDRGQGRNFIIR